MAMGAWIRLNRGAVHPRTGGVVPCRRPDTARFGPGDCLVLADWFVKRGRSGRAGR